MSEKYPYPESICPRCFNASWHPMDRRQRFCAGKNCGSYKDLDRDIHLPLGNPSIAQIALRVRNNKFYFITYLVNKGEAHQIDEIPYTLFRDLLLFKINKEKQDDS